MERSIASGAQAGVVGAKKEEQEKAEKVPGEEQMYVASRYICMRYVISGVRLLLPYMFIGGRESGGDTPEVGSLKPQPMV